MIALVGGLAIAYLAGAFPTAYLVGRAGGVDLGEVGSGNYGATNVFRNLGGGPAVIVLVVDVAKGFAPVWLLPGAWPVAGLSPMGHAVLLAVAAVLGHVYSPFLGFRGGKGIGTAAGAYLALAPWAFLAAALVWVGIVLWRRIVSLASLAGAVALLVSIVLLHAGRWTETWPLVAATAALTAFVFWTHRENLGRLRRGDEAPIASPTRRRT